MTAYSVAILLVGLNSCWAWSWGAAWCARVGVTDRLDRIALGSLFAGALFVLSVHLPAGMSLLFNAGWTTPLTVLAAQVLLMATAVRWLETPPLGAPQSASETAAPKLAIPRLEALIWLVLGGTYALFFLDAVTRFPNGYDDLHYHLPLAVEWSRARALVLHPGLEWVVFAYPDNGMLLPFLLAFERLSDLFPIVLLPQALLLALIVRGLARSLGAGAMAARLAATVALSMPIVLFQAFSTYIDLYAAVKYLAAFLALSWAARVPSPASVRRLVMLAGLGVGLALGSKFTYLVLGLIPFGLAMSLPLLRRERDPGTPRGLRCGVILCGTAAFVSGFWFFRAWMTTGNPIHPLGLTLGGVEWLPGYQSADLLIARTPLEQLARWWHYPWTEIKYAGSGYPASVNNGVGAAYAALVPIAILAFPLLALARTCSDPQRRWRWACLAVLLSFGAAFSTIIPPHLRFMLAPLLLSVAISGAVLERLLHAFPRAAQSLVLVGVSLSCAAASLPPLRDFASRVRDDRWEHAAYYQLPGILDELPPGTRILLNGPPNLTYPLLGRKLDHDVLHPHRWLALQGNGPLTADALRRHRVDIVLCRPPTFLDLSEDLPLTLLYDDSLDPRRGTTPATRIYSVLPYSEGIPRVLASPPGGAPSASAIGCEAERSSTRSATRGVTWTPREFSRDAERGVHSPHADPQLPPPTRARHIQRAA